MKKTILLTCLMAISAAVALAQDGPPPPPLPYIDLYRVHFGAFIAPNISWMKPTASTDDEKDFGVKSNGTKLGFTYGIMADYFFAPNYGLISGIQITSTGGKIIATAKDPTPQKNKVISADFDYSLQYLEVPLALKLRSDMINGFRFFGQAGLTAGINISKKADYTVTYYDTGTTTLKSVSDTKAKITGDFGAIAPILFEMNLGAGLEYPVSNKLMVYLGLFFNNGFAPDATKPDLFDAKNLGYSGKFRDANTRLNNVALRIGLFF